MRQCQLIKIQIGWLLCILIQTAEIKKIENYAFTYVCIYRFIKYLPIIIINVVVM